MFSVGIGPSSSHTVGPMRAALLFARRLETDNVLACVHTLSVELYGSLGATGRSHCSDKALILGLLGETPETTDPDGVDIKVEQVRASGRLNLLQLRSVRFEPDKALIFHKKERLPLHVNGMRFRARDRQGEMLIEKTYYSVGGGFVIDTNDRGEPALRKDASVSLPYPFRTAKELLELCEKHGLSMSALMLENEKCLRTEQDIRAGLLDIWRVMQDCVARGCRTSGILPGGLKVRRRAAALKEKLVQRQGDAGDAFEAMDWVNLYALAVNEENAAGGRVVTAPTNGAAGIIPAVLHYYWHFCDGAGDDGVVRFLLTAAAIGTLYKLNASISGAEVGCQGEVGSACSMAAGALTEVLGGSPAQVEQAAEIAMEHNLGLTCDPVGGLVQIPCIERNAIASVKAINAARMALLADGQHYVSLDKVIKTMRDTGRDMKIKYKETARGGLAVNVIEC
jgi:L-serine dehydratase